MFSQQVHVCLRELDHLGFNLNRPKIFITEIRGRSDKNSYNKTDCFKSEISLDHHRWLDLVQDSFT